MGGNVVLSMLISLTQTIVRLCGFTQRTSDQEQVTEGGYMTTVMRLFFGTSAVIIFSLAVPSHVVPEPASVTLIYDVYGEPLGLTYVRQGTQERGELGLLDEREIFVFVRCGDSYLGFGERFMRRLDRNCKNNIVDWPDNLVMYLFAGNGVDSSRRSVRLTSPPQGCGMCLEEPFVDFDLPPDVEVLSEESLQSIVEIIKGSSLNNGGVIATSDGLQGIDTSDDSRTDDFPPDFPSDDLLRPGDGGFGSGFGGFGGSGL